MSPIGTHSRVLMGLSSGWGDDSGPVWSPDSKTLLLSRVRDPDNGTFDIYMLDTVTGKTTKKFKNVAPVYAWVDASTSVYRNQEYGISLPIPSRAWLCSVPYKGANHGAAFLLGTKDESLCTKASGKRWISIFAGYNAAEESKTLHALLNWQCANEASGSCGQAPMGLRINGLSTETARVDRPDGSITIIVVAQAGKPDPDFDASAPSINYDLSLHTDASHLDEDLESFRAMLNAVKIAPRSR